MQAIIDETVETEYLQTLMSGHVFEDMSSEEIMVLRGRINTLITNVLIPNRRYLIYILLYNLYVRISDKKIY